MTQLPHRRRNLLTDEWVLVSPHRAARPWQGAANSPAPTGHKTHDPSCYLCPTNMRANGELNPDYEGVFIFDNDFAALLPVGRAPLVAAPMESAPAAGEARVICYTPDHGATLARMSHDNVATIVKAWCQLSADLGQRWRHVQIFENKGEMMGASSPHPHGQVWASDFIPGIVAREDSCQRAWLEAHQSVLLDEVVRTETASQERVVELNQDWIAIVPHWAAWPFETMIVARRPVARLEELGEEMRRNLAVLLGRLLRRYDGLFAADFPYSMGWHGAPHGLDGDGAHWRLHAHFYPPLLRSASIRKHMVGFELLAETQRDLTPEEAASRLVHVVVD